MEAGKADADPIACGCCAALSGCSYKEVAQTVAFDVKEAGVISVCVNSAVAKHSNNSSSSVSVKSQGHAFNLLYNRKNTDTMLMTATEAGALGLLTPHCFYHTWEFRAGSVSCQLQEL